MEDNVSPPPPPTQPPSGVTPPPPPPPSSTPPPVIMPMAYKSPPRKPGRGWMILALVLLVLLALSMLSNLGNFASSFLSQGPTPVKRTVGPRLDEVLREDNDASDKIVVVPIDGIITSRGMDGGYNLVDIIKAQLQLAEEDNRVKAIILKVDSPGGEVLASDEIYRALSDFQKKSGKPVIASMGNLAASGGYYISAPCRWIVANDLTITGSIGVILHSWNYRGLMNKVGLRPETYKSGKFKDMLSGERDLEEIPPEEREMVQNLIDETYEKFKSIVEEGRNQAYEKNKGASGKDAGRKLAENWEQYADGRVLSGTDAHKYGFVDQLGNFQDAVDRAKLLAKIPRDANLIEYQLRYDFSDIFRVFGQSETRVVKVDVGFEPPRLTVGQLYFLSPTFAH